MNNNVSIESKRSFMTQYTGRVPKDDAVILLDGN